MSTTNRIGLTLAIVLAVATATTPAHASTNFQSGGVLLPTVEGHQEDSERAAACAVEQRGRDGQGLAGWVIAVTPGYRWRIDSRPPMAMRVAFYSEPPTCSSSGELLDRSTGAAGGTVPVGSSIGVVTMAPTTVDIGLTPPAIDPVGTGACVYIYLTWEGGSFTCIKGGPSVRIAPEPPASFSYQEFEPEP